MKTESTPFMELEVTGIAKHIRVLFFYSLNEGKHGRQVITHIFDGINHRQDSITNGSGFNKAQDAFDTFLMWLLKDNYTELCIDPTSYLYRTNYHKGGNYYEIPIKNLYSLEHLKKGK
jgi:hypothetical protein